MVNPPEFVTMLLTVVLAETETSLTFERRNVATSAGPLGTVFGIQFAAVFQSLLMGLTCQVALPAWLVAGTRAIKIAKRPGLGIQLSPGSNRANRDKTIGFFIISFVSPQTSVEMRS
jgi:hypothetical protein